ncbi:MAG TPA: hypothetical protein VIM79_24470 [Niastella sp.]
MKKLLFALLLSFAFSGINAQVKSSGQGQAYNDGNSYGYYIDELPGAVSYEWSVQGNTGAVIWPAWDTAIDLTFSYPGMCDIICTVTFSNGSVEVYALQIDVYEAPTP